MKILFFQAIAITAVCLLVLGTGTAYAFPGQNAACTDCHANGVGDLTPTPDPLNLAPGDSGLLSFVVASLPAPAGNNMIALEGLTVAGLAATIGAGGDNWSLDAGAVADTKSDEGIGTGPYNLDLEIGLGASLGTYELTWYLAGAQGAGPQGFVGNFTVNVIPEPATLALLGFGLTGMAVMARRRKREPWQKE